MCGFTGIHEYGRAEGDVTQPLVERMRDTLAHRGPDGEGAYVSPDRRVGLGHRRLAIVDIAGGAQPMIGPAGEVLVFNGEIYNYPRLRVDLERDGVVFKTRCDTEVILHLYRRYGDACVEHLTGMFAFALWDEERSRMLLARDPVGEKPLYYSASGGRLLFGSEIKSILQHPSVTPQVNGSAIEGYLANLVTTPPETLFDGICKLPAGTIAVCDDDGLRLTRYHDLFTPRSFSDPSEPPASVVRRMLDQSVHDRLMSDVPLGVLLSGGLDSTALVALLHEKAQGLATFCVGFRDQPALDERSEARRVAAHYGTDHHEVEVDENDAIAFLTELVHHQDEPLADPVCLPLHFVCRLAADNDIKVLLAGEGSDELFWGYPSYLRAMERWRWVRPMLRFPRALRNGIPRMLGDRHSTFREQLEGVGAGRPLPAHFPLGLGRNDRQHVLRDATATLSPGWSPSNGAGNADPLDRLVFDTQEYEFALRLPELLLMRIDRFSMSNSVEARVPFLDPALVDYVYRLPLRYKLHEGTTKVVLRDAVADSVPQWVLERRKQGFGAPVNRWFSSRLGDVLMGLIDDDAIREHFDAPRLRTVLEASGRSEPRLPLWSILNFALWHRYWIQGESLDEVLAPLAGDRRAAAL